METQLQVGNLVAFHQPQGVETRLLMTAFAVGADQFEHAHLLALVLDVDATGPGGGNRAGLAPADQFEVRPHRVMGDVRGDHSVDLGQGVEVGAPLFGHGVGVVQIGLVKALDIGCIPPREMGGTPKPLDNAL